VNLSANSAAKNKHELLQRITVLWAADIAIVKSQAAKVE
jgi:hypothetical protein